MEHGPRPLASPPTPGRRGAARSGGRSETQPVPGMSFVACDRRASGRENNLRVACGDAEALVRTSKRTWSPSARVERVIRPARRRVLRPRCSAGFDATWSCGRGRPGSAEGRAAGQGSGCGSARSGRTREAASSMTAFEDRAFAVDVIRPRLHAVEVEHLVDHAVQALHVLIDVARVLAHLLDRELLVPHHLAEALDPGQAACGIRGSRWRRTRFSRDSGARAAPRPRAWRLNASTVVSAAAAWSAKRLSICASSSCTQPPGRTSGCRGRRARGYSRTSGTAMVGTERLVSADRVCGPPRSGSP